MRTIETTWVTFGRGTLLCLSLFITCFSWSIVRTSCEDDLRPVNFYLSASDEYVVRSKLVCRGWPCPNFTVAADVTRYVQERRYVEQDVVTSSSSGCDNLTSAVLNGYIQLYRYRKGENVERKELGMAVPFVVQVTNDSDKACDATYKIWIYVNVSDNDNNNTRLPTPSEKANVKVERMEALNVYVRTFTGNYTDPYSDLLKLQSDLHQEKLCFSTKRYMIAMYDPPWKKSGRRNEIWVDTKSC